MAKKEIKTLLTVTSDTPSVPVVQDEYVVGQVLGTVEVKILDINSVGQYSVVSGDGTAAWATRWFALEDLENLRKEIDPEFRKKKLLEKKAEIEKQLEELDK